MHLASLHPLSNISANPLRPQISIFHQIAEDIRPLLRQLCQHGLLIDAAHLTSVDAVLPVLSRPELQAVAKRLGLPPRALSGDKAALRLALLAHASSQQTLSGRTSEHRVLRVCCKSLGECWRLSPAPRRIFKMAEVVFFKKTAWGDRSMSTVLLDEKFAVRYPRATIRATQPCFASRRDLHDYAEALEKEYHMELAQARNAYDEVERLDAWACRYFAEAERRLTVNGQEQRKVDDVIADDGTGKKVVTIASLPASTSESVGPCCQYTATEAEAEAAFDSESRRCSTDPAPSPQPQPLPAQRERMAQLCDSESRPCSTHAASSAPSPPLVALESEEAGLLSLPPSAGELDSNTSFTFVDMGLEANAGREGAIAVRYGLPWAPFATGNYELQRGLFLRQFTAAWVCSRMMSIGCERLEREHQYSAAAARLRRLLRQEMYGVDSRGRWLEKLALHYMEHLGRPAEALRTCNVGLRDPFVRTGHKVRPASCDTHAAHNRPISPSSFLLPDKLLSWGCSAVLCG